MFSHTSHMIFKNSPSTFLKVTTYNTICLNKEVEKEGVVVYIGLTLQNNFDFRGGRARQVGVDGLTGKSFAKIAPSQAFVDHTVYDDIGVNNLQAKRGFLFIPL